MCMPYPWRVSRCHCGKLGTMNYRGEYFCAWHYPFKEHAQELNATLFDIVGKEKRDALIDQWFPNDADFNWEKFLNILEEYVPKLDLPTGLLDFYP
jgi:hypothetical protein